MAKGFGSATDKKKPVTDAMSKANNPAIPPVPVVKHELPAGSQFMGGWIIQDESVVDDLIAVFNSNPDKQLHGMVSMQGGATPVINKEVKESREMSFGPKDTNPAWQRYLRGLGAVMAAYVETYPMCGAYGKWGLTSRSNFQYYPPGGGYKTYHTERTGAAEPEGSRHLVFMTYLNDVDDAGGTEFYHQGITVKPVKGLTLVWPADWTFTHRGIPSPTQEKMIVTGWFNFLP